MGRKFWLGIIYVVSLLMVLAYMVERLGARFTDAMFLGWLAAFTAGFVTYVMGNAAVAAASAAVAGGGSTVTSTSTSTKTESKAGGPPAPAEGGE